MIGIVAVRAAGGCGCAISHTQRTQSHLDRCGVGCGWRHDAQQVVWQICLHVGLEILVE